MSFSASDVKELRERTGAGMMACKQALTETKGDLEKAVDYLRSKGLAAAAKKQGRIAAEGLVTALVQNSKRGILLEVNCETDFVGKSDDFKTFVNQVATLVLEKRPSSVDELKTFKMPSGLTVDDSYNELTLKIGEKIDIRRFESLDLTGEGAIVSYIHGAKIAVLVQLKTDKDIKNNPDFIELGKDLAMQVAAASPVFLNGSDISEDFKNREAEIYATQLKEQGKAENMIPNIIKGKLAKLASEVCLLEQAFVKDPEQNIKTVVANCAKKIGAVITVEKFKKINLGEGIEKKQDNLAEEVAKLTKG